MPNVQRKILSTVSGALLLILTGLGTTTHAQSGDMSPVLLIESGPSDNPNYRRMVFVKFLSGDRVSVNYKAYNRTEFKQVPDRTPLNLIRSCSNGPSTPLSQIQAFERENTAEKYRKQPPKVARFCIKNIQGWEGGNRARYLDPIFNGMPRAARFN